MNEYLFNACKNTTAQVKYQCAFIIFCVKLNEKISTHLNLIWKPTDLPRFDVTSSWLVKMCLIFTMGQNDLTIHIYISEINEKPI